MKSIFYFSVIFICLLFIPQKSDLRGHWHVHGLEDSRLGDIDYTVMEIFSDKTARFGISSYSDNFNGNIDTWNKTIAFGGECRVLDFDYQFNKDGLLLIQQHYGGKFKAIRCDMDCCDQQKDFFSYQKIVNIDLPIAKDTSDLFVNNFPEPLENRLLYGLPKIKYHINCFGLPQALVLGGKVSHELDIPIWHEKIKVNSAKDTHPFFKLIFYTDKKIEMNKIGRGLEKCKEIGYRRVYFALRSRSVHEGFKIWLKPFDLSNLEALDKSNDFRTIGEWLTASSTTPN